MRNSYPASFSKKLCNTGEHFSVKCKFLPKNRQNNEILQFHENENGTFVSTLETGAGFWIAGMPATDVGVSETEGKIYPSVVDMI